MKEYRNGWNQTLDLGPNASELSEDLEWVLQSGQSDPNLVAEGLLHTYYAPVYRLCMALENDPQRLELLLLQTFARAVNQAYRYRPKTGIPIWFYYCFLHILPHSTHRERRAHLPVLLHVLADLSAEQIADLLNLKASRVKARLDKLDKAPQALLAQAGLPPDVTDDLQSGPSWRQTLQERFPAPALEDNQLETLAAEIVALAEKQNTIRRRWLLVQELALLLVAALAVAGLIIAADSLSPPSTTPTPSPSPVVATRVVIQETAPSILVGPHAPLRSTRYPTPSPIGPPLRLDPLTVESSPLSVLERLRIAEMFWETVSAEAVTVLYPSPGYLGPNRVQRTQFWLSADQARIQSGPPDGQPDELWVGNRQRLYVVKSRDSYSHLPELVTTGSLKRPSVGTLGLIFDPLHGVAGGPAFSNSGQLRLLGSERIAGRDAIIVELLDASGARASRLWLDTRTNFVLRRQLYRPSGAPNPAIEVTITWIDFDSNFNNQSLFDVKNPRPAEFTRAPIGRPNRALPTLVAQANSGDQPQPPFIAAPPGFDPAPSRLRFLYPPDFNLHSPEVRVEVLADEYHLGSAEFANPWWMICERSPDGKLIAAASHPLLSQHPPSSVSWLDLTDMSFGAQQNLPVANVSELAFAPDSRRLALLSKGEPRDSLYLVDLKTGELRLLAQVDKAHSLTWSPTGDQILLISEIRRLPGEEDFVIIDTVTGQVVKSELYDPASLPTGAPSQGQEYNSWYDNSSQNGGLEACVAPPSQPLTP